jgi:aspartyl protease family protein
MKPKGRAMLPDEYPRFVYLIILGTVIGGYFLLNNRHRLGKVAQQAAIWGLIFLGVIIVYGFRDTLTTQLFPRRAVIIDAQTVALRRARDGHFYADLKINGQKIEFIVDTGASDVVLSNRDADRLGIDRTALDFSGRANTANGVVRTASITLARVDFGSWTDFNIPAQVNEGDLVGSLLGMSYLSLFSSIQITGDKLLLTR